MYKHLGFPYHTCVHCKGFAAAAPRRARTSISVSFWGLPLSWPLLIVGMVGRYPAINLISRQLILQRYLSDLYHSRYQIPSGINLSFPRLSQTVGQITDVLLSILLVGPKTSLNLHA